MPDPQCSFASSEIAREYPDSQTIHLRDSASKFFFCDPFSGTQNFFHYPNSITSCNPYSSSLIQQQSLLNAYPSIHYPNSTLPTDYSKSQSNVSVDLTPETFSLDLETPSQHSEEKKTCSTNRKSKLIEKQWTTEDDYYLRECVERYRNDWKKVFKEFKKRYKYVTIAFLKAKYKTIKTNPFELRVRFTHDEDLLIARLVNSLGKKWDLMATYFPNRTPIMIKNRYYSYIKKRNIMKDLLAEAESKDTNSESVITMNPDFTSNDSNSYKSKILNLECNLFEDPVDQFFTFGPEDQLNERITPFSEFECHFDDDIEIMACAARKTTSMPETVSYDHIIDPRSSHRNEQLHSSLFSNDISSQPVDEPNNNFPGTGPSFQDSNLKK